VQNLKSINTLDVHTYRRHHPQTGVRINHPSAPSVRPTIPRARGFEAIEDEPILVLGVIAPLPALHGVQLEVVSLSVAGRDHRRASANSTYRVLTQLGRGITRPLRRVHGGHAARCYRSAAAVADAVHATGYSPAVIALELWRKSPASALGAVNGGVFVLPRDRGRPCVP